MSKRGISASEFGSETESNDGTRARLSEDHMVPTTLVIVTFAGRKRAPSTATTKPSPVTAWEIVFFIHIEHVAGSPPQFSDKKHFA